ncbi:signal peptide protein peptidase [Sporothrix brasiliensis 5110]|uniref:Signal peptide protein peptidase n=1 Tax=Sporothrix brasiliensis 5110 TaxID=1398154 RepID=A0A0C2IR65_9PEZI|nr:signal peptide protein peptidase [Sporothrix brasiliensis 5110]KIH91501.1 signal peptide protein peptidase [Sporothrix brasiliensis 5110]
MDELALNGTLAGDALANITANITDNLAAGNLTPIAAARAAFSFSDPSTFAQLLYAYRHMFIMEARILGLALGVIYLGAHASLSRPHSAAPRDDESDKAEGDGKGKTKKRKRTADVAKESIQLKDALLMPFFAAAALIGFYYLIQYMQDPALLNRILRAYMSLIAVASVGAFLGGGLSLASSLVFPNVWTSRRDGHLHRVDGSKRTQWVQKATASDAPGAANDASAWELDPSRTTPFPDMLAAPISWLPASSAARVTSASWAFRRLVRESWSIHVSLRGVGEEEIEGLTIHALIGMALAGLTAYLYYFVGLFPSLLNNIMGLGMSYLSLQLVSGTSFAIGSTVLIGLFVYDVVMVFYTPFMVAVATQVDAPIKIVAGSGPQTGMLGLGDIVVPGIYMCLCLRYDLYRHYARQIKHVDTTLTAVVANLATDEDKATTTKTSTATREVKPQYIDPQGRWGDRLWTSGAATAVTTAGLTAARFSKPYFYVSMVAYVIGLMAAMAAMLITRKGQPALFYLVPALLVATWGRAAVTGDLKGMWAYTEDDSQDTKDVVVEVDADGKLIKADETRDEKKDKKTDGNGDQKKKESENENDNETGRDIFVFAIRAPPESDFFEMDI